MVSNSYIPRTARVICGLLSGDGLYKYDKNADYFSPVINPATGKELGPVASMVEDDQKNIWITSITGIIKFSKQQNTFLTYGPNAGIKQC